MAVMRISYILNLKKGKKKKARVQWKLNRTCEMAVLEWLAEDEGVKS